MSSSPATSEAGSAAMLSRPSSQLSFFDLQSPAPGDASPTPQLSLPRSNSLASCSSLNSSASDWELTSPQQEQPDMPPAPGSSISAPSDAIPAVTVPEQPLVAAADLRASSSPVAHTAGVPAIVPTPTGITITAAAPAPAPVGEEELQEEEWLLLPAGEDAADLQQDLIIADAPAAAAGVSASAAFPLSSSTTSSSHSSGMALTPAGLSASMIITGSTPCAAPAAGGKETATAMEGSTGDDQLLAPDQGAPGDQVTNTVAAAEGQVVETTASAGAAAAPAEADAGDKQMHGAPTAAAPSGSGTAASRRIAPTNSKAKTASTTGATPAAAASATMVHTAVTTHAQTGQQAATAPTAAGASPLPVAALACSPGAAGQLSVGAQVATAAAPVAAAPAVAAAAARVSPACCSARSRGAAADGTPANTTTSSGSSSGGRMLCTASPHRLRRATAGGMQRSTHSSSSSSTARAAAAAAAARAAASQRLPPFNVPAVVLPSAAQQYSVLLPLESQHHYSSLQQVASGGGCGGGAAAASGLSLLVGSPAYMGDRLDSSTSLDQFDGTAIDRRVDQRRQQGLFGRIRRVMVDWVIPGVLAMAAVHHLVRGVALAADGGFTARAARSTQFVASSSEALLSPMVLGRPLDWGLPGEVSQLVLMTPSLVSPLSSPGRHLVTVVGGAGCCAAAAYRQQPCELGGCGSSSSGSCFGRGVLLDTTSEGA